MGSGVRHTVFLFFDAAKATADKVGLIRTGFQTLMQHPDLSGAVTAFAVGPDLAVLPDQPNFVITADFVSLEAYKRYATHPEHLALIESSIKPLLARPPIRAQIELPTVA